MEPRKSHVILTTSASRPSELDLLVDNFRREKSEFPSRLNRFRAFKS